MLVIRRSQLEVLGIQSRVRFEQKLVDHFLRVYPRECRQAGGAEQVRNLVRNGIDHGLRRGFTAESQIGLFVALRFIVGAGFDRDPQIPWAAEILDNPSIRNLDLRIHLVYDRALQYLEYTAGEDCEHVVRAMIRLRDWDLATAPATGAGWSGAMLELLRGLYPQKIDYQGEAANGRLIADGLAKSESYGIGTASGAALCVILMFMLGSEFDGDDLHPWAARVLSDKAISNQADRIVELYRASRAHLEVSLSPD